MASTNKTKHLGLCQWEADDPFLRVDLNGDLAKIDTAFEERTPKKLFDITVTEPVSLIQLDFTGIDLTPYAYLEMFFSLATANKYLRLNEIAEKKYYISYHGGSTTSDKTGVESGVSHLALTASGFVHAFSGHPNMCNMRKEYFPELNSMEFFCNEEKYNFAIGDRISIWGVVR